MDYSGFRRGSMITRGVDREPRSSKRLGFAALSASPGRETPECEIWPATSTRPELPVASARVHDPQIPLTRRKWNGENDEGFIGLRRQNQDQAGDRCGRKLKKLFSFTGKRKIFSSRHLSEIAVITRNSHFVRAFAGDSAVLQIEPAGGTALPHSGGCRFNRSGLPR